jgi:hypothetical protein
MEGYIYVLFDAQGNRCKIGRTRRGNGKRQQAVMGAHPVKLLNVLNAKVPDCKAAEIQCHRHFAESRKNGEWFDAGLADIVQYIHEHIDWMELDFESLAVVTHQILQARLTATAPVARRRA